MVSYTVRVDKVKDYTHNEEVVLTKRNLRHATLNAFEFKLEAVQIKVLRQGNIMEKHIKDNHAGRGVKFTSSYLPLSLRLEVEQTHSFFLNHHL